MTDQELLAQWADGRDPEAFREVVNRHASMVYATCRRILRDATEAEDTTQECFEALVKVGKRPGAYLGAWLHRVATNLSLRRLRSEARRLNRETQYRDAGPEAASGEWAEIYAHVDRAINELPERFRAPLVMHFLEGQTHEAIAEALGVARTTVTYRLGRGLDRVKASLRNRGVIVTAAALTALGVSASSSALPPALSASLGRLAIVSGEMLPAAASGVGGLLGLKGLAVALAAMLLFAGGAYEFHQYAKSLYAGNVQGQAGTASGARRELSAIPPLVAPSGGPVSAAAPTAPPTPVTVSGHVLFEEWLPSDGILNLKLTSCDDHQKRRQIGCLELKAGDAFAFENVPAGKCKIEAFLRSATGERTFDVPGNGNVENMDVVIAPKGGILAGVVSDPDHHPLPETEVTLYRGVATMRIAGTTVTNEDGRYEFRFVGGTRFDDDNYMLRFVKRGYHLVGDEVRVSIGQGERRDDFNYTMAPGQYTVSGMVVSDSGEPVAGMGIVAGDQSTQTGVDGTFTLPGMLDACSVQVDLSPESPWAEVTPTQHAYLGDADEAGIVFQLTLGGTVVARLNTCDGQPDRHARYFLDDKGGGQGDQFKASISPGTLVQFAGVRPGMRHLFIDASFHYAFYASEPFEVRAGQTADLGPITLEHGGALLATFTFPDGSPAPGGFRLTPLDPVIEQLPAFRKPTYASSTKVEDGGLATHDNLRPGRYAVESYEKGLPKEVVIRDGQATQISAVVPASNEEIRAAKEHGDAAIDGVIAWTDGSPADGFHVELCPAFSRVITGPDGAFHFAGLNPDREYQIEVSGVHVREKKKVKPGESCQFTFQHSFEITGRVVYRDGTPVLRAAFEVTGEEEAKPLYCDIKSEGVFKIDDPALARGKILTIHGQDFLPVSFPIHAIEGGKKDLGTITVDAGADVRGQVISEEGEPVHVATVAATPVTATPVGLKDGTNILKVRRAVADSQGLFVLPHMQEAQYRINVAARGYAECEQVMPVKPGEFLRVSMVRAGRLRYYVVEKPQGPLWPQVYLSRVDQEDFQQHLDLPEPGTPCDIEHLAPGRYRITANYDQNCSEVTFSVLLSEFDIVENETTELALSF